ncbi:MAG: universal stress protein [Alcanivoracaceae bacterium]|nr:universal stress protein [Alcanivoracaceae bacterium]
MTQVVACIDGSAAAMTVCDYAAWAAKRLGAPLTLLHVLDEARFPSPANLSGNIGLGAITNLQKELSALDEQRNHLALEQGREMLDAAKARANADGIAQPTLRQRHGALVSTLTDIEDDTRLLVIGKQGEAHSDNEALVGDNVERVVRSVHRPVLITTGEYTPPRTIMLAFDGSPTMDKAVDMIAQSPLFRGLPCHLVKVGEENEALQNAAKRLRESGLNVVVAAVEGEVEQALHTYQNRNGIDLVVMGAYGHSRIREFFVGSTTNSLLRGATVPHLVLR